MKNIDIGIDHPMMHGAKMAINKCLEIAITRAIGTGSNEGSASLKISFEINTAMDERTGELSRLPLFKYKAGFSVPVKESVDATISESSTLVEMGDGWKLITGQISMDEIMGGTEEES